jgi:hypothetical protein
MTDIVIKGRIIDGVSDDLNTLYQKMFQYVDAGLLDFVMV